MTDEQSPPSQRPWKLIVLILVLATMVVIVPVLLFGVPASRDTIQHYHHAMTFFDSMSSGDMMPSWMADSNGGYGDVSVRFYPPGLSLLLASFRLVLGSWYLATIAGFGVLSLLGGFGVYLWAVEFVDWRYAVWAGALFIVSPYHINELFQAALLAEYGAVSVLPLTFAFAERIAKGGGRRDVAGLGAAYALLVLFNLPMAVIGSYALFAYLLLRLDWTNLTSTMIRFATGIVSGVICSAFYWVTVISELRWLKPDTANPFSSENFLLSTLHARVHDTGIWYGNLLEFSTLAIAVPALVLLTARFRGKYRQVIISVGVLTVLSVAMATLISRPLWDILPKMKEVQLPWRWMAVTSMCVALLAAASIPAWIEIARGKGRPLALLALGAIMLSVAFTISHPIREARYYPKAEINAISTSLHGFQTIGQWFPLWSVQQLQTMDTDVFAEGRPAEVSRWSPEHRQFAVGPGASTEVRVRTLYYPLWRATVNGAVAQSRPDSDGALLITIPQDAATVSLDFREPRKSTISGVISLIGWVCLVLVGLIGKRSARSTEAALETVQGDGAM